MASNPANITRGDPLPAMARRLANLLHKCHASVGSGKAAVNAQDSAHTPKNSTMMQRMVNLVMINCSLLKIYYIHHACFASDEVNNILVPVRHFN